MHVRAFEILHRDRPADSLPRREPVDRARATAEHAPLIAGRRSQQISMPPDNESAVGRAKRMVAKRGTVRSKDPPRWRDSAATRTAGVNLILRAARCPQPPTPDDLVRLSGNVNAIVTGRRETP
jgi:hypothetical protein